MPPNEHILLCMCLGSVAVAHLLQSYTNKNIQLSGKILQQSLFEDLSAFTSISMLSSLLNERHSAFSSEKFYVKYTNSI